MRLISPFRSSFADRCDRRIPLELFVNESCETFAVDVFNEQVLGYLQGDLALTFSEDKMSSCARFIQDADCDEDVFELLTACNSRHDEHFILDGQPTLARHVGTATNVAPTFSA